MECNQKQSPLLKLPPELRNKIYDHVLEGMCVSLVKYNNSKPNHIEYIHSASGCAIVGNPLNLLSVCRQVYLEASLLPYTLNSFQIRYSRAQEPQEDCLRSSQLEAVKKVALPAPTGSVRRLFINVLQHLPGIQEITMLSDLRCFYCGIHHVPITDPFIIEDRDQNEKTSKASILAASGKDVKITVRHVDNAYSPWRE